MPIPTRPVTGAATATPWGQAVHDAVFTPKGVRVAGGASSEVGTVFEQLQLNTAVDDPVGWLASDSLTVPSQADGLYFVMLDMQTDNGDAGERTRVQLRVNGSAVLAFFIENDDTNAVTDSRTRLVELTAGDVVTVYAAKTGGLDPDVLVRSLDIIQHGQEMGG